MNQLRRTILKGSGAASAIAVAVAAGLLKPSELLAAEWNKAAFETKTAADALNAIGAGAAVDSKDIVIKMPELAETAVTVPIEVTSKIAGTESIMVVVEKNPNPLVLDMAFANGGEPYFSGRIKMMESSKVKVIVRAGGKVYSASKDVKVTIGGCG